MVSQLPAMGSVRISSTMTTSRILSSTYPARDVSWQPQRCTSSAEGNVRLGEVRRVSGTTRAVGFTIGPAGHGLHNSATAWDTECLPGSDCPRQCHCMPGCQRWEQSDRSPSAIQTEDGAGLAPLRTSLDLNIFNQPFLHASHAQVLMHKACRTSRPVQEPNYHSRPGAWPLWASLVPEHRLQRPYGSTAATSPGSQLAPSCTPNHLERPIPPTPRQCDATASRVKMIQNRVKLDQEHRY